MSKIHNHSIVILLSCIIGAINGFTPTPLVQTSRRSAQAFRLFAISSEALRLSDKDMEMERPKLGISITLDPMSAQDLLSLKEDVRRIIDQNVMQGVEDLELLREKWHRNILERNISLEHAMNMNGKRESDKFNFKVDAMVGKFLSDTNESRQLTHHLTRVMQEKARAKQQEIERKERIKYEVQSWGKTNNEWDKWDDWDDWNASG